MSQGPLISIITPTINSVATIERCLASVADQTYQNIEHLIIDGLSTDGTLELIDAFKTKKKYIRLISEKDQGVYDAMNKGLKYASGDWIYYLGGDDRLFSKDIIMKIVNVIIKDNYDVIYGDVFSAAFNGRYDGEFDESKLFYQNICHQALFIKTKILRKFGPFNTRYRILADWDFNMKWFFSPRVSKLYIDEIIAEYGDRGISTLNKDDLFQKHKTINYLSYGSYHLPLRLRGSLYIKELRKVDCRSYDFQFLARVISRFFKIFLNFNQIYSNKQ